VKPTTEYYFAHRSAPHVHVTNAKSPLYDQGIGSLGEQQLQWAEAQLAEGKPTSVFIHYPLWIVAPTEVADFGLHPLLRKYREHIKLVVSGHWHKWIDFAHTFGSQHYVMAATRYDASAYVLIEIDRQSQTCRFINAPLVECSTDFSRPYRGKVCDKRPTWKIRLRPNGCPPGLFDSRSLRKALVTPQTQSTCPNRGNCGPSIFGSFVFEEFP